jgi:predicted nucleotidyltransferase
MKKYYVILTTKQISMNILQKQKEAIEKLCANHHVRKLYAFGSVLTDDFKSSSDIDLIVDFQEIELEEYADNYFDFKFSLQDILKRQIDLLEEKAIKNPFFRKSIDQRKQLIYGRIMIFKLGCTIF